MGTRIAIVMAMAAASSIGLISCKEDGQPSPGQDAGPDDDGGVDAGPNLCGDEGKGFLDTCADSSECGTCECRAFGHSMQCTAMCEVPEDCPAPSRGCAAGYCRN